MTTVAFCGLGAMGLPMAHRLVNADYDLRAWNRTRAKADALERATATATPGEAAADADVVITMLATPEAVRDVVTSSNGIAASIRPGATLIEMSTIGPDVVHEISAALPAGVTMLDAPVLGSIPQATDGELKVWTGGDGEVVARWRDLLETFGTVSHVGVLGHGAGVKLAVNSTLGALMTALGEALVLAQRLGLDQEKVFDVLMQSPIAVTAKGKRSNVTTGNYDKPNFKLALAAKDMRLVTEAARRTGAELKVAEAARSWFELADAAGLSDLDYSAVIAQILGQSPDPAGKD
jgi:3-hydroxyisobutyrate dehydrogenase-like beta-hydroxyacid dehydrogenase